MEFRARRHSPRTDYKRVNRIVAVAVALAHLIRDVQQHYYFKCTLPDHLNERVLLTPIYVRRV